MYFSGAPDNLKNTGIPVGHKGRHQDGRRIFDPPYGFLEDLRQQPVTAVGPIGSFKDSGFRHDLTPEFPGTVLPPFGRLER